MCQYQYKYSITENSCWSLILKWAKNEPRTSQNEPNFGLILARFLARKTSRAKPDKSPSSSEPSQNLIENFRARASRAEFPPKIFELERAKQARGGVHLME